MELKEKRQQNVVFMLGTAVDLSRDGRWHEPTRDGFLRATDDALVDVLTGGQRHPRMMQLLPWGSNINKLFIPVQENCNEVECVRAVGSG